MTTTTRIGGKNSTGVDRVPAELINVRAVAGLLQCSRRTVYRLADAGRMPRPVKLGQLVRWRRAEVLDWIGDGCPMVRRAKGGAS